MHNVCMYVGYVAYVVTVTLVRLRHLKLSVDRFKCASAYISRLQITINKHFIFCCFRALAYTTLDRLCAIFLL